MGTCVLALDSVCVWGCGGDRVEKRVSCEEKKSERFNNHTMFVCLVNDSTCTFTVGVRVWECACTMPHPSCSFAHHVAKQTNGIAYNGTNCQEVSHISGYLPISVYVLVLSRALEKKRHSAENLGLVYSVIERFKSPSPTPTLPPPPTPNPLSRFFFFFFFFFKFLCLNFEPS